MKTFTSIITFIGLFFVQFIFAQISLADLPKDKIMVVAHRGDWRNFPENSIKAVENAMKLGADIVEVDLKRSKDGILIILHDKTLDRTTTGKGLASEKTWSEIQKLKLRNGAGMPTQEKIPTLEELLNFIKGKKVLVNLDKAWDYFDEVFALIEKTDTKSQIILKGNSPAKELKAKYGKKLDGFIYMPMVWPTDYTIYDNESIDPIKYMQDFAKTYQPIAYEVIIKDDNKKADEVLKFVKDNGALIWINALWAELCAGNHDDAAVDNPEKIYGWYLEKGANIIQTDRIELLVNFLKSKNAKYEP
ncbi:MAG: glycerophosphodiester phosphodiesterase family protein [Cruoricaptor ignavus]|nr:glycerophosphodiester phosphodiesterase family protein [Cruoricaptor ignavus]